MTLGTPLKDLGIKYRMYAKRLDKLGIRTVEDLLLHIPSRYEDYTIISPIRILQTEEVVTIKGTVRKMSNMYTKFGKRVQSITVSDETSIIDCVWFNQPFVLSAIKVNDAVSISGKVGFYKNKPSLMVESYETIENESSYTTHTGRLVPIYPETRGLSSKWIRNRIKEILSEFEQELNDYLPSSIKENHSLIDYTTAIQQIHFPENKEIIDKAKYRLAFDELLLTQMNSQLKRKEWEAKKVTHFFKIAPHRARIQDFWEKLPFELTGAQKKAVREIFADLASHTPMNRLLEGDVGSGKTVVATIAMYIAYLNGFQSALMAPTEILANQHFETISNLLTPLGVKVDLVTGSRKTRIMNKESTTVHDSNDILVGTHALLSEKIKFDKLGLVVIDEQQRFGVEQRAILREKGILHPHFLTMTATPIPRTIFLTLYGDLDLSYLDEMPKGRQKVKTWLVPEQKRQAAYDWIKKQIKQFSSQAFIICPFIEISETMQTVKAATAEFERLQKNVFPKLRLGLMHGKLKAKDKQKVLESFKNRDIHILVATPVVEVGIDIPNATIMLIETAERFGLAQIHQMRGRVGRGIKQSYCILFAEARGEHTIRRLKALETMYNGAELAELDLKLRGPGQMYGKLQHGRDELKIASFSDFTLIEKTRHQAEKIFPHLDEYPALLQKLKTIRTEGVSPD